MPAGPLLAALAAGAAQGYGVGTAQNTQMGMNFNLNQMQDEVKMLMDQRIAERAASAAQTQREFTAGESQKQRDFQTSESVQQHGYRMEELGTKFKMEKLQLKQMQDEMKIPPAVKMSIAALDKRIDNAEIALFKAMTDPLAQDNLDGLKQTIDDLLVEKRNILTNSKLMPEKGGKIDINKYINTPTPTPASLPSTSGTVGQSKQPLMQVPG